MTKYQRMLIGVVLLVALAVRVWDWPHLDEYRDVDEWPYLFGSASLLEGVTPAYKFAPAGPQTWLGWAYLGMRSAVYVVFPTAEEQRVDIRVRPFIAVNHAIWDFSSRGGEVRIIWIIVATISALLAVYLGAMLGHRIAGTAGLLLCGGTVAVLPLYVLMNGDGRPYALAWSLSVAALSVSHLASTRRQWRLAAILHGLAIASRIDMLALLPFTWSPLLVSKRDVAARERLSFFIWLNSIVAITSLLAAPWILTSLIGNLRIIATVRVAAPVHASLPVVDMLQDLLISHAMLIPVALFVVGCVLPRSGERRPRWLIGLYGILIVVSMLKPTGYGFRHHGAPLTAVVVFSVLGLARLSDQSQRIATAVTVISVALVATQTVRAIHSRSLAYVPAYHTTWIENNVEAGSVVYLAGEFNSPLPTENSAKRLWSEVNDGDAWKLKFLSALRRFNLTSTDIPPALSEENMLVEKANRRRWFILGSRQGVPRPRYDIKIYWGSPIFGVHDIRKEFELNGGAWVYRGRLLDDTVRGLTPTTSWYAKDGSGLHIFCSRGVLLDPNAYSY